MKLASLSAALLAASSTLAAQNVLVVDDDGNADHLEIQAAVAAAADGDVVLVRSGTYAAVTVTAKSLHLIADTDAAVVVEGPTFSMVPALRVDGLAAGQAVVVRGMTFRANLLTLAPSQVELEDNGGSVWLEDCAVEISNGNGIGIDACDGVTLTRCTLSTSQFTGTETAGLHAAASNVALYGCDLVGPAGSPSSLIPPGEGGPGVVVDGGELLVAGGSVTGGRGGDAVILAFDGGDGGDGLVVEGGALVRLLDVTLAGGEGGSSQPPYFDGEPGAASVVLDGTVLELDAVARSGIVDSPIRAGFDDLVLTFAGSPGDLVLQAVSMEQPALPAFVPVLQGALVVATPFVIRSRGILDASGALVVTVPTNPLGPGVRARNAVSQTAFLALDGSGIVLGAPSAATLLDARL